MKKILGIYNEYKIMPNLQMHQLRVASVASLLCDSIGGLDKESVITACLFHDMGNIVKFYLPYFPQLLEPEGLAYWQNIKDEYIKKYGSDEHKVTEIIAREIKMPEKAYSYLSGIGFSKALIHCKIMFLREKSVAMPTSASPHLALSHYKNGSMKVTGAMQGQKKKRQNT